MHIAAEDGKERRKKKQQSYTIQPKSSASTKTANELLEIEPR